MIHDVAIIGGGIVGCAIARELSRYHLDLVLLEKDHEVGFGTSKSNSGIIHAGHHGPAGSLKGEMEWAGNRHWDVLHAELDFGFERIGEVMVATEEAQVATLAHYRQLGADRGVTGLQMWGPDRLRVEEPALDPGIVAALHAPTAGVVNPYEVCFSLIDNARANGLELRVDCPVTAITRTDDGLILETGQGAVAARFVINAAGLYADAVAAMAGAGDFTIRPRKGEEYLLDKRLRGLIKRIIFPCPTPTSKGILIIPTFDGTIMIGPTANPIDDKEDRTTTDDGGAEVFAQARRFAPGISEKDCIAEFAGLRAVTEKEDFIIGPTAVRGFINVAGIQSPGLTAAPAIALRIADILADEGLALVPDDGFVPRVEKRTIVANLSTEDQIRLTREDARYGHICCRCEMVTEGEVVDAIAAGANTLDGIKFRTRAGMGRCQGGFCTSRCMELLARELDLPFHAITKRGGGSWVVCSRDDHPEGGETP